MMKNGFLIMISFLFFLQPAFCQEPMLIELPEFSISPECETQHITVMTTAFNEVFIDDVLIDVDNLETLVIPLIKLGKCVYLKNERKTKYQFYIKIYRSIKSAYANIRNEYARENYGYPLELLAEDIQEHISELFPTRMYEYDPQ